VGQFGPLISTRWAAVASKNVFLLESEVEWNDSIPDFKNEMISIQLFDWRDHLVGGTRRIG